MADEVKLKDLKKMTPEERREAVEAIYAASRAYIHQTTEKFLKNFQNKDRFQLAVKQEIIKTLPPEYLETFLKRMDRLTNMAESQGYVVNFSKWRTTKEYGWFYVREG